MDFERVTIDGVTVHTVPELFERYGIGVAFSEREGGVSVGAFSSLDLAAHVGDDPVAVDRNRDALLTAIGIAALRERLTCAEQIHGIRAIEVTAAEAGAGGFATGGPPPHASCDALWTRECGVPLMLLFADCVPIVLVRPSVPAVAVVHAGWRGLAAGVVEESVAALPIPGDNDDLLAFIGPHIGPCCYEVGCEVVSHFDNAFVTIAAASTRLDLGAAVMDRLERSGVPEGRQWHLGICTAHNTERFYSHRAEGRTGRHGALAVIL